MFPPAGGLRGVGEDWTSGKSLLQSIDESSLGTQDPGFTKKAEILLISDADFGAAEGVGFMINLLRVQIEDNSLLIPMSANHTRWWQEERSNSLQVGVGYRKQLEYDI